jgi:hypothetical protein
MEVKYKLHSPRYLYTHRKRFQYSVDKGLNILHGCSRHNHGEKKNLSALTQNQILTLHSFTCHFTDTKWLIGSTVYIKRNTETAIHKNEITPQKEENGKQYSWFIKLQTRL